jgi:hypothetical protein
MGRATRFRGQARSASVGANTKAQVALSIAAVLGEFGRHPWLQLADARAVRSDHRAGVPPVFVVEVDEVEIEAWGRCGEGWD